MPEKPKQPIDPQGDKEPPRPIETPPLPDPLLNSLQNWRRGGQLIQATKFREQVFRFLKNSLPIYDPDRLSPGAIKYFLSQRVDVVDFENADTSAKRPILSFESNEDNANFLEALLHLANNKAQRSEILIWEKTTNIWLKQNEQSIIDKLQTGPKYHELVKSASKFLAIMQQLFNRKSIPNDELEHCQFVLQPIEADRYSALGKNLASLARDLPMHIDKVRDFVISEVSLRQGTGGDNFIDPQPIIEGVKAASKSLQLTKISEELFSSRFASRYQPLQIINKWSSFPELIEEELGLTNQEIDTLRLTLVRRGCITDDGSVPLEQYFDEVLELDKVLHDVEIAYNDETWNACKLQLKNNKHFSKTIKNIEKVIANPKPDTQLQIDVKKLQEVQQIVNFCEMFLDRTEQDLKHFLPNDTGYKDTKAKSDQNKDLINDLLSLVEDKTVTSQEIDYDKNSRTN